MFIGDEKVVVPPVAQVRRSSEGPHGTLYAGLIPAGTATPAVKEGDLLYLATPQPSAPVVVTDAIVRSFIDAVNPIMHNLPPPAIIRKGLAAALESALTGRG